MKRSLTEVHLIEKLDGEDTFDGGKFDSGKCGTNKFARD